MELLTRSSSGMTSPPQELLDETEAVLDEIDAVLAVEVEDSATLDLWDLIDQGSQFHPQAIGSWTGPQGETCALSAALDAAQRIGLA